MRMRKNQTGFTLIEILVVVVIVATVTSVAMLSFNLLGSDRELRTEGRRLAAILEVTQDEAAMQGREFGVELMRTSYRFVEYDGLTGLWTAVANDDILRLRELPEDVEFELYLEDQRILLDNDPAEIMVPDEDDQQPDSEPYAPHLLVFSSGESTPFELHIWRSYDQQRIRLRGDPLGTIEVIDDDEI